MKTYKEYRKAYPEKTDAEIITLLASELSQKVETIHELLERIKTFELGIDYSYGSTKNYKAGDVVVWKGSDPCIGRIMGRGKIFPNDFKICDSHNSLYYGNLRYARPDEIKRLGKNQMILIENSEC